MKFDPTLMYPLAAGTCVFFCSWLMMLSVAKARQKAATVQFDQVRTASPLLRLLRPLARWAGFLLGSLSARVEMRMGRDARRSFLLSARVRAEKMLRAAGRPEGLSPDEFLGLILVCAFLGLCAGLGLYPAFQIGILPLGGLFAGAVLPIYLMRGVIKRRHTEMRHMLPYALDLLTLSVEAGLDFTEALGRIVKRLGNGPLAVELGETLRQIQLGKTRGQALRDLAFRCDLAELRSIVGALIQTDELGGTLGPVLRAQAEQLRNLRSQSAEKAAMEAPVKILFPLILFIFPTLFIMIFAPIALQVMKQ